MENYAEKELRNCTFVKTILMLLVVFYHSILFWSGDWFTKDPAFESAVLSVLAKWMNSFHIYGFALVSGYIFYYLKYEKGRYQAFGPFVLNKAKRLLVPYVTVLLLWVLPVQYSFFRYNAGTIVKNYILAVNPNQLWFLLMLFNVFLLAWLLSDYLAKHNGLAIVIALGAYCISVIGPSVLPNVFMIWRAFYYLPIFIVGIKMRQYGTEGIRRIAVPVWVALHLALFILNQIAAGSSAIYVQLLNMVIQLPMHTTGAIMSFVVLQKVSNKVSFDGRFAQFLSRSSMIVYLLHQQIIYFFITGLNGYIHPYLNGLINFAGSLSVSLLAAYILLKFKTTKFLFGEK